MDQIFKVYRVIIILAVIGGAVIFPLDLMLLYYGEIESEEAYLSLIKLVFFSIVLWGLDKVLVKMSLLSVEPEYLGFIKKVFHRKK